jgi:hypothetical protein
VLPEIEAQARSAGFDSVEVGVSAGWPTFVPAEEFESSISPGSSLPGQMVASFLSNRRLLRLRKGGRMALDSRRREHLTGRIKVEVAGVEVRVTVENTGLATWIQAPGAVGHVSLGAHLFTEDRRLIDYDYFRLSLSPGPGSVAPGEHLELHGTLPPAPPGRYLVTFDLVSEEVCWFADNGGSPVTVEIAF